MSNNDAHQLPWPKLNHLLGGGVADSEVMAICSAPKGLRTTVCIFIAGHFIEKLKKKVTFFTNQGQLVREGIAMARLGYPLSTPKRPEKLTYWSQNGSELDIFALSSSAILDQLLLVDADTAAIIIDDCHRYEELARAAQYVSRLRSVPVFYSVQLRPGSRGPDVFDYLPSMAIGETADHVIALDLTNTLRFLVMELVRSYGGVPGALLLDTETLQEAL